MKDYAAAGVDYDVLDKAKRDALSLARSTSGSLARRGGRAVDESRGEPAFLFELGHRNLAFVVEGLGTKSVIARAHEASGGPSVWAAVAQDTVAAIVNDLICVGALPLVVNAYFATGSAGWFVEGRLEELARGWASSCEEAGAVWGGGESPTLPGLVAHDDIELAGSAVGEVPAGTEPILGASIAPGDEIVLVASSGLHANGASLIRRLADRCPDGLGTPVGNGLSLGDAALAPSIIYVRLVEALLRERVPVTYLSHITGHGLRKLMRADASVTYRIRRLPEVPALFSFVTAEAGMDDHDAYGTFNMGAGFAVYVRDGSGPHVAEMASLLGYTAIVAGVVEEGPRRVILEPVEVEYAADDLSLR